VRYETSLTGRTREIAILLVAAHWNSVFERDAHESVGRAAGLTEDELATLQRGSVPALVDAQELACAELVHAMLAGDIGDDDWVRLVTLVGHPTVFELSTLVGYYATLALQLRIFRVDGAP
jgi:4-carboxymuconolactone decarboxylase